MTRTFSTYLDLLRFTAALTVMAAHFTFPQFTGGVVPYQGAWAGAAVTAFFVLSGYVIRYVSVEKECTLSDYAISRMARIYSVAIPALILTIGLDAITYLAGWPKAFPVYQYTQLWKYLPIFLTFTSEVGPIRENVLTDGTFWSLSYEVWYYILFAAAFYLSGWKRSLSVVVVLAILGPRILIYLPIWLAGVGLYELHRRVDVGRSPARLLFVLSLVGLLAIRLFGVDDLGGQWANTVLHNWPHDYLRNSQNFVGHYTVAAMIALNIFSARYAELNALAIPKIRGPIVYCASFTFALYLGHRPLMDFYAFLFHHNPHSPASVALLASSTLATVWLFGLVSEHRKAAWRRLFTKLVGVLLLRIAALHGVFGDRFKGGDIPT